MFAYLALSMFLWGVDFSFLFFSFHFHFHFLFSVFYFEGKSLKRRQAADILRICQVKVRSVCVCFYLHFTILLLDLPISKRRKMFHTFVAYFCIRGRCFLIYICIYICISIDLHTYIRIRSHGRIRAGFCLFCA